MAIDQAEVVAVFHRVDDTLHTAWSGYEDFVGLDYGRRMTGLRNMISFGRSVTFVLQNLRSKVEAGEFDEWYAPHQDRLKADPLMKYFVQARNELEKQGMLSVANVSQVGPFSMAELNNFPRPPGATAFFIGDQFGGSGWMVELPDGSEVSYYVDLPKSIAVNSHRFTNLPEAAQAELGDRGVDELSLEYLTRLSELVDAAKERFLPAERPVPRRTHLRLVK